jgi:hypothetical protein
MQGRNNLTPPMQGTRHMISGEKPADFLPAGIVPVKTEQLVRFALDHL